jgi:hypothetical protein
VTALRSAKVLAFDRPMASPASGLPQQSPQTAATAPVAVQIHGNTSQRFSAFFAGGALLVSLIGTTLTIWWHFADRSEKQNDEHFKTLIGDQINPIIANTKDEHINTLIAAQNKPLTEAVGRIAQDVSTLKGWLHIVNGKLDKVKEPDPQLLAQSSNPDKALTGIRATLEQAQDRHKILPDPTLVEYRKKVQILPTSATEYWTTVAAIINYQSYVNQREHNAPDPFVVSKPCPFVTSGSGGGYNVILGANRFTECVVDLDGTTNEVDGAVFEDSVIRWHGGPVTIKLATFIRCRFVLDIKTEPSRPELMQQLLASDQTYFTLKPAAG